MFLNSSHVFAQDNSTSTRLFGSDRYETSVAISKAGWVQATTVIITSGLDYPDALSAASLSKLKDAPILLTPKDALEAVTIAELKRLKATNAIIIGGTGVIGTGVEKQLTALGIGITRIGGKDRYDTCEKVAQIVGTDNGIIVSSALNFPDALSIAPIAGIKGMPILLSPKDSLDPNIAAFIKGKSIPVSYVVGGTGVLDSTIDSSVPNSTRLSGDTRYATNLSVNNQFTGSLNFNTIYLASGNNFPDALCGAALAAKNNAPIFLTDQNSISDAAIKFIKSQNVQHVVILGGTSSVSQSVESAVNNIVTSIVIHSTSVSLNKTSDTLTVGGTDTLKAEILPNNTTNQAITWKSSDNTIATVDDTGNVTAVSAGTATITVTTADGSNTATCNITVTNPVVNVTSVSLNKTSDNLSVGDTDTLTATVLPDNATSQGVTWTSSDNSVVKVDSKGDITAIGTGTATIIVTTADGSNTAVCNITVTNPVVNVTSVSLNKTSDNLSVGDTDTLTATVLPDNATSQGVTWTSSDNSVVKVDNKGDITAVGTGTATIIVTTADGSNVTTCNVTVTSPITNVKSVSLNKTKDILTVGGTDMLTANVAPDNATNQIITWTSSDNSIVTVDNVGSMTAVSPGTATITVTTEDGNKTATCNVIVTSPVINVTSVSLNKGTDTLISGGADMLTASVLPVTAGDQSVTWMSSNNNVATVDTEGNVTAVSPGNATITAVTMDGSFTASCTVTVTDSTGQVPTINLDKTSDTLIVSETDTLAAEVTGETNQGVTWTSSDDSVVTVDNTGNIKAISAGTAIITATTADGSLTSSCNVTVFNQGQGHMLISSSLVNFTASYEGYSATPYVGADSQNHTIGYGHVILPGENYTDLTQAQAWNLLLQDLQNTANQVNSFTSNLTLSQQQFDALVDFAYNCGVSGLQGSTLMKDINAGASADKLKTDFQMWSYCNGTPLVGLYRRRTDEWQIYTSANYSRDYPPAPNGYV
jgi:uncharacterized protein YjdB